jgi:branched-chain amino acid transport system substrate-binding protein
MNTTMRRFLWPVTVPALILGLAACGGGGAGGNGPGPKSLDLVIGNVMPLSGGSKALGQSGEKASRVALAEINDAIQASGADHRIRLVNVDQGADADSAVASVESVVKGDGASCVTGPWSSQAVARSAQEVSIPARVLQISPVATGDDVADLDDHDLVDSTALPVSAEGEALARAIGRDVGGVEGHTANVAAAADPGLESLSQDFIQGWQDDGGTVGGPIALTSPPATKAAQITAGEPEAVLLVDDATGFAELAPGLSSGIGWNPAIAWGNDQLVSPAIPAQVGAATVEGMRALAPGIPDRSELSTAFVDRFEAAPPQSVKIAPFAAQQFDATVLCYLAAVAAGSTDGQEMADELIDITAPGGTQYSWRQLPEAIKALEDGEDINYTGASGSVDMDVHGDPTNGVFDIFQYVSGELRVVGEVPVTKPNPVGP